MTIDSRTASTVDVNAFRKAMGSFPTGVTLVTVACDDGTMHGVTVGNQHRPPGSAMFDGVPLEPGVTGCPILAGAAASFDCRLRQSYHAGDHLIVLGEVVTLIHRPPVGAIDLPRRDVQVAGAEVPARSHKCAPLRPRLGRTWPATAPTCGLSGE